MSNITNPKYKLPSNLNVTSVTGSGGFKGDLVGTASNASKFNNLNSSQFARTDQANIYSGNQTITGYVSASNGITGSFKGDGSQLTNLPATSIPSNLSVTTVTASAGFKGNLIGTASVADTLDGINSTQFAILTASNVFTNTNIITGSFANGVLLSITGIYSHAEGSGSVASGAFSHAEGETSLASGKYSHSEGFNVTASGFYSHAEGYLTIAFGNYSHAEGRGGYALDPIDNRRYTIAYGTASHAEGGRTEAHGDNSHTEGSATKAYGASSHAEGLGTIAYGDYSHSEGFDTIASASNQHVQGRLNQTSSTALMLIGNGDQFIAPFPKRSNIFEVYIDKVVVSGSVNVTDLQSPSTKAVYADSTGKLTTINNTYTYDTVNRNATYKATISGSAGTVSSSSFFTTDTGKGKFIPSNCMFYPTAGSNNSNPTITVGVNDTGFTLNDLVQGNSLGSLLVNTEFIEVPLKTPNGAGACKAAPENKQVWWTCTTNSPSTQITGTLILSGYYLGA